MRERRVNIIRVEGGLIRVRPERGGLGLAWLRTQRKCGPYLLQYCSPLLLCHSRPPATILRGVHLRHRLYMTRILVPN